jgi:hypothetical protein
MVQVAEIKLNENMKVECTYFFFTLLQKIQGSTDFVIFT